MNVCVYFRCVQPPLTASGEHRGLVWVQWKEEMELMHSGPLASVQGFDGLVQPSCPLLYIRYRTSESQNHTLGWEAP